jgi:hypothetical protein
MEKDTAKIIIKHIAEDTAQEILNRAIETETDWDKAIEEIIEIIIEKEYNLIFKNLNY